MFSVFKTKSALENGTDFLVIVLGYPDLDIDRLGGDGGGGARIGFTCAESSITISLEMSRLFAAPCMVFASAIVDGSLIIFAASFPAVT